MLLKTNLIEKNDDLGMRDEDRKRWEKMKQDECRIEKDRKLQDRKGQKGT